MKQAHGPLAILLAVAFGAVLAYSLRGGQPRKRYRGRIVPIPTASPVRPAALAVPTDVGLRPSPLRAAEPSISERLALTPEQSDRVGRIVEDLNRECARVMRQGIDDWLEAGGYRSASPPDFADRGSPYGQTLDGLRRAAEQRVLSVLTPEQRGRLGGGNESALGGSDGYPSVRRAPGLPAKRSAS